MPALINSDDGVVSGSSGLKTTGANDGILALQNNGTTNVTVTAAGNVGIGINSPSANFQVNRSAQQTDIDNAAQVASFLNTSTDTAGNLTGMRFRQENGTNVAQSFIGLSSTGNSATRASLIFAAPNTSGNAVQRAAIDSSGNLQFNSGYGSVAIAYGCRAWVNFNGTGTVAIRASGNVTSITDNGTGDYTVNFTTAMPDANFSAVATVSRLSPENENFPSTVGTGRSPTTSTVRLHCRNYASASLEDSPNVNVAIFR